MAPSLRWANQQVDHESRSCVQCVSKTHESGTKATGAPIEARARVRMRSQCRFVLSGEKGFDPASVAIPLLKRIA